MCQPTAANQSIEHAGQSGQRQHMSLAFDKVLLVLRHLSNERYAIISLNKNFFILVTLLSLFEGLI